MAVDSSRFRAAVGVLLLTAVLPAAAQNATSRSLPNEPGKWKPWTFINLTSSDLKLLGFTLPDARAFETRLKQIAEIFRTSPVWNPPMGVDPSLSGMAFGPEHYWPYAKKVTYRPIAGYIMLGSFAHFEVIRTTGGQDSRRCGRKGGRASTRRAASTSGPRTRCSARPTGRRWPTRSASDDALHSEILPEMPGMMTPSRSSTAENTE